MKFRRSHGGEEDGLRKRIIKVTWRMERQNRSSDQSAGSRIRMTFPLLIHRVLRSLVWKSRRMLNKSYELTRRWNMCLVVTDGSAVLGLGDIGPEAGMPVMEGKCVLFKAFGDVDAFPLCIKSNDVDEIVNTIYLISGSFGGVNLEDISAPRCFEIEKKLKEKCDIPIFHDDQHGTAIITLAGLTNALKVVGKKKEEVRVVMNGAGAAAISIARLLLTAGVKNITLCDRKGAIYEGRKEGMNPVKEEMSKIDQSREKIRFSGRYASWRRCIYRSFRTRCCYYRYGKNYGKRCHHLCMRKPDTGDLPG